MSSATLSFYYFFLSNTNVATVAHGIGSWPFFFPAACIVSYVDVQFCVVILANGWETGVDRGGWRGGIVREFEMNVYTMYLKWITHKDRLYRTGNTAQCPGSLDARGVWGIMDACTCTAESLHCSSETITTILIGYLAHLVKNLPAMRETWVWSPGQEDILEKEMATHPSNLVWEIPWTEEPGRLQSMGSQESEVT